MKKLLLVFMFMPYIALSSDKKEKKELSSELQQLQRLLIYFESQEYQTFKQDPLKKDSALINQRLLMFGTPLLKYPRKDLTQPLKLKVNRKTIHLINIETYIKPRSGVIKHYSFLTGSKQYRESDGSPWEKKDFMVINIEKSGQVKPPLFSQTDTYMCIENGYH